MVSSAGAYNLAIHVHSNRNNPIEKSVFYQINFSCDIEPALLFKKGYTYLRGL
jgi:hypothetical protein